MAYIKYNHDWKTIKEHTVLNEHQKSVGLGNVQDAIEKFIGKDAYAGINKLDENNHKKTLYSSRGKKLLESGRNVLEIDVAGSGFGLFQAQHKNVDGEGHVIEDGMMVSEKAIREKKFKKVGILNKISLLQKLPGFMRPKSEKSINKYNEIIAKYSAEVPLDQVRAARKHPGKKHAKAPVIKGADTKKIMMLDKILMEKYGKKLTDNGAWSKIRVKNKIQKTEDGVTIRKFRCMMPGPLKLGGVRDAGDYSIDNLREYMLTVGEVYLGKVIKEWQAFERKAEAAADKNDFKKAEEYRAMIKPVTISLKGHSRGAVAASHGAMKIKNWLHENYPQYEKNVDFELVQYDPVPGYFSDKGTKHRINIRQNKTPEDAKELKKLGMMPLGDKAQTTVIYSMHADHPLFFSPQNVNGAKRVIFVPEKHAANLDMVDKSQGQPHRKGYTDASTGEVYRGSGLSELPEGVYMADEKLRVVKMPNPEAGHKILKEVTKSTKLQSSRHRRLNAAIDNWFADAKEREILGKSREKQGKREKIGLEGLRELFGGIERPKKSRAQPKAKKEEVKQQKQMGK